jgi:hypothetical protein
MSGCAILQAYPALESSKLPETGQVVREFVRERIVAEHGVDPARRRLFIIDGSKALRGAINAVFGAKTPPLKFGCPELVRPLYCCTCPRIPRVPGFRPGNTNLRKAV